MNRTRVSRRPMKLEPLEDRRLLATLEGNTFTLPAQVLDPVGYVGNLSAEVDWGDGSTSAVSVNTPSLPNGIRIRFDYSLDTSNFFANSTRRALLQDAADSITQYLSDSLSAIVPSGINTWSPMVCHPSLGASTQLCGPITNVSGSLRSVAANEIVVFAGARDYAGNIRAAAGPGFTSAQGTQSWLNTVAARGQAGALGATRTDFARFGGHISFDNRGTDWYFNRDIDGIQPGQLDFYSVAAHEIMHIMGFGFIAADATSSWERLTPGSTFNGQRALAAYSGAGFPPVEASHWADSIDSVLMGGSIPNETRQLLTRLDLAALDDLGWDVTYPSTTVITGQQHVYADDGDYPVVAKLNGARIGDRMSSPVIADINNVAPSLTVPGTQSVIVGNQIDLPADLWQITDPGFANPSQQTAETFTYTVDWADGSNPDTGNARITTQGSAGNDTVADFSVSHSYQQTGAFNVSVTVQDDDGGEVQRSFRINVFPPPALGLELNRTVVAEDAGESAAVLTVTRTGPVSDQDLTVSLAGFDTTEVSMPSQAVISAGEASTTILIDAVDDSLLDGTQEFTITANASGVDPASIMMGVTDAERLFGELLFEGQPALGVLENRPNEVVMRVTRSNTDVDDPLTIQINGGDSNQLTMSSTLEFAAGQRRLAFRLFPVDDDIAESTIELAYRMSADGYQDGSIRIQIFDDERSAFQNPTDVFDVNDNGSVTAGDALRIINQLALRTTSQLNPMLESRGDIFPDTTGDYFLSARDALVVINELANRFLNSGEGESVGQRGSAAGANDLVLASLGRNQQDDDDDVLNLMYDFDTKSVV